ncbi:MAG: transglycosylase domain-containing protein [Pseudomonadota bacterium]
MTTLPDQPPSHPSRIRSRVRQFADTAWHHLSHPTRRGVALAIAAIPVLVLLYVLLLIPFTPSISDLRKAKTAKPSVVMSSDGKELAVFRRANREWVKLEDISPNVVNALIATEDRRFYDHHGMDFRRTAAAALNTFKGDLQGGSTITQQLARNLYPEDIGRAATLTRKVKEAITALKIESVYTKDEILETYLNTVPFLYNAYGIEMAARTYFDKSADELDVLESATLIGMLKGTSYYNPVVNPGRALQRRNTVLAQMVRQGKVPEAKLAALQKTPLKVDFERQEESLGPAPHLTQQLKRWLIEWADKNDYNIYADGLVLRTTIDARLQNIANASVTAQMGRLQSVVNSDWLLTSGWNPKTRPGQAREMVLAFMRESKEYKAARAAGYSDDESIKAIMGNAEVLQKMRADKLRLQAGFMAVDPTNGHIKAWVGSRDYADDQFDHVSQARRQPGSTFKPFVYGAAFENGSRPNDVFVDQALEIPLGNGNFWRPGDAGGPSGATMTLRQGLMYSKNSITAQVMQGVGPQHVARLARSMGVRQSKMDEVLSLALGTSPVTLKEMVTSYSTLANDGRYIEPVMITRVEDRNGKVLEEMVAPVAETAMATTVAQTLIDVLRGAIDQGTGTGIRSRYGIRADVAGKTGTTQDNTDAWFMLMSPQLVAGAWVGFNDNRVTMGSGWGQGAQAALPIVGEFFRQAYRGKVIDANATFAAPRDTSVPADPGLIGVEVSTPPPVQDPGPIDRSVSQLDGNSPREGSWQPSPGIKYVTVQVPAGEAAATTAVNAEIVPRDLQPPEPRKP